MMTEQLSTIARPYAKAAFEYALEKSDLASWEAMLKVAAEIAQDETMLKMLHSPKVTHKELVSIFCEILGNRLDKEKKNFIELLAQYERLNALPEIVELFSAAQAQYEKTMDVELISAIPLEAQSQQKFIEALTKRLKRKVTLRCEVDPKLLGGALVRAGDMVIDGSIRGKLNRLIEFI